MLDRKILKRAAARAPRFPLTAWAGVAWAVLVLTLLIVAEDGHCSVDAPCTGDWLAPLLFGTLVLGIVAQFLSARLGFAGALATALSIIAISLIDVAPLPWPVLITAVVTLSGASIVTAYLDRDRRTRRREFAARGLERRTWPGTRAVPLPREALAVSALAAVAALGAFGVGFFFEQKEAAWQDAAPRAMYQVVAHSEDAWTVYAENADRQVEFEPTFDVNDYPVGTTVLVWDDGDKVRPVAEPYDPLGWQLVGVALAAIAFAFGVRLLDLRRDLRAVLSEPMPCKRVGVLGWGFDEVVVFDRSDVTGRYPRLLFRTAGEDAPQWGATDPVEDADDIDPDELDDWPEEVEPPLAATAYGYLVPGELIAVKIDDETHLIPAGRLKSAHDLPRPLLMP